jgi:hypothetical protein
MIDGANRGGEDLRFEIVIVVDLTDLLDHLHAVLAGIVEAADEGRDESGARLGGQQSLIGVEAQRHIDLGAGLRQSAAGLEAFPRHRHLHRDVGCDAGKVAPFGQHAVGVERRHLGADRALDHGADLAKDLLEIPSGLGNQARIGGDAVEQAHGGQLPDFPKLGSIGEKLHDASNIWLAIAQWRDQYTGVAPSRPAIRTCP